MTNSTSSLNWELPVVKHCLKDLLQYPHMPLYGLSCGHFAVDTSSKEVLLNFLLDALGDGIDKTKRSLENPEQAEWGQE